MYGGSFAFGEFDQFVDRISRTKRSPASRAEAVDTERVHVEATNNGTHPADVIAVGMSDDREIDASRVVVALDVVDERFAVVLETRIDDDVPQGAVECRETRCDRIAGLTLVAHR